MSLDIWTVSNMIVGDAVLVKHILGLLALAGSVLLAWRYILRQNGGSVAQLVYSALIAAIAAGTLVALDVTAALLTGSDSFLIFYSKRFDLAVITYIALFLVFSLVSAILVTLSFSRT